MTIDQPVVAIVIVPADGDKLPLAPTFNAPLIVKLDEVVVVPLIVRPENARVLELEIEPPVMVTVPPAGEKLPAAPTERALATLNETFEVFVPLNVTLLKVNVPELLIVVVPVSKVIVPPVGARVFVDATVNALLIV